MAWVTKDSVEQYDHTPEPPKEYSKKEKTANWWHYNKWKVLGAILLILLAIWIIHDVAFRTEPDYRVAYVGRSDLPIDTAEALETALAAYGEDVNGDGQVLVELCQYNIVYGDETENVDAYSQMAGVTRLYADLDGSDGPYVFLVEEPETFVDNTGALQYLDGTLPSDDENVPDDWHKMVYHWTDCPVLAGLDLGEYQGLTVMDDLVGNSQDLMANLYVGRRAVYTEKDLEGFAPDIALWDKLTESAVSTVSEDE